MNQVHILQRILVGRDDTIDTVDFGIKDVSVESEAVRGRIRLRGHGCPKTERWYLLVRIIVLQDASNRFQR